MNHGLSSKFISDEDIAWAIENGYWKALRYTLKLPDRSGDGVLLRDLSALKEGLLHILVRVSTVEAVAALLDSGVDVNARNGEETALHIAIERGDSDMVALLLSHGAIAQLGSTPGSDRTLMTRGDGHEKQSSERRLRGVPERGASRDAISVYLNAATVLREYGQPLSPIMRAVMGGREDIVELYLEMMGDFHWNKAVDSCTVFDHAIRSGNAALVEVALKSGADPNSRTCYNQPVFHSAIKSRNPKIIEALVRAGARLDERDEFGRARLSGAFRDLAHDHDLFTARVLVELGVDREQLLRDATAGGADEIVLWLLASGVEVNHQDDGGCTPLLHGVSIIGQRDLEDEADTRMIELLLRSGADPNRQTNEGESPQY